MRRRGGTVAAQAFRRLLVGNINLNLVRTYQAMSSTNKLYSSNFDRQSVFVNSMMLFNAINQPTYTYLFKPSKNFAFDSAVENARKRRMTPEKIDEESKKVKKELFDCLNHFKKNFNTERSFADLLQSKEKKSITNRELFDNIMLNAGYVGGALMTATTAKVFAGKFGFDVSGLNLDYETVLSKTIDTFIESSTHIDFNSIAAITFAFVSGKSIDEYKKIIAEKSVKEDIKSTVDLFHEALDSLEKAPTASLYIPHAAYVVQNIRKVIDEFKNPVDIMGEPILNQEMEESIANKLEEVFERVKAFPLPIEVKEGEVAANEEQGPDQGKQSI
jgi:hypothetical protein